mmetsp:Transcript_7069/g.13066  ORF Transcript_7069/g.13066 Transcript_7069/m.13066 type:complete len:128 (+) Transcript_7069:2646-3029(+)
MLYDNSPGGLGIAEGAFSHIRSLLQRCASVLRNCNCVNGCLSCCFDPKCPEHNDVIDKAAAILIIDSLLPSIEDNSLLVSPMKTSPQKRYESSVQRAMAHGRARAEQLQIEAYWTEQHPNHSEDLRG